jgi:hypothetical protein
MPKNKISKLLESCQNGGNCKTPSCSNAVYGLGMLGAVVYYWQTSPLLTDKLIGIIKAIFWPAFLVYKAMQGWGM